MKNTLITILVLSQVSAQEILTDLLCNNLGLLEGFIVGGLESDLSPVKDFGKANLGAFAEKLPENIKDDFEDKDLKRCSKSHCSGYRR
ncbi:hypothetical protein DSO57_1015866 [Entomophthora muscae]|uniref:Uncharacterized protein n=1 Tax=Entomophthora muscae TaxID=34485 RepID=A0ACC2UQY9_9FUNG|nr:hypothetical protein DSO57_1015866 [Entomophthora muscae]